MTWNYRVVKTIRDGELIYGIHENYQSDAGEGWTENPIRVYEAAEDNEDPIASLRSQLQWMMLALDKPVIDGTEETETPTGD